MSENKKTAPKMVPHYFNRAMGTTGAVTGKPYAVRAGQSFEAPEGEFDHVGPVKESDGKGKPAKEVDVVLSGSDAKKAIEADEAREKAAQKAAADRAKAKQERIKAQIG